jgi:2'-5' RNA ligase
MRGGVCCVRLFVAVDIDDETRRQLGSAREAVQAVLAKARVPPRVTWVKDEAAHVTLRFIGETPEGRVEQITQAIARRFDVAPVEIRWQHVGSFPQGNRPHVIWIGAARDSDLATLAAAVEARLTPIVGPGESRPFTAHITLGRVKESGKSVDWPQALAAVRWTPTITRIDHITLYASRTSPKGPTYTSLIKTPLAVD